MDEDYLVKDRFQDVLLAAIYDSIQEAGLLIFKGGTAIRKVYGSDRYSDDLDFNLDSGRLTVPGDAFVYGLRDKCVSMLSPLYDTKMYIHMGSSQSYTIDATLKDSRSRIAKIRIEINTGRIYKPPLEKRVIAPDVTYFATVMDISEMLSEKIRAVYTRRNIENTARDLVDIAFLVEHGGRFDLKIVNEKLRDVKHRPFSSAAFSARVRLISEEMWQKDLGSIMKRVPERSEIVKQVMEFVRKAIRQ